MYNSPYLSWLNICYVHIGLQSLPTKQGFSFSIICLTPPSWSFGWWNASEVCKYIQHLRLMGEQPHTHSLCCCTGRQPHPSPLWGWMEGISCCSSVFSFWKKEQKKKLWNHLILSPCLFIGHYAQSDIYFSPSSSHNPKSSSLFLWCQMESYDICLT